jgi:CreA protein
LFWDQQFFPFYVYKGHSIMLKILLSLTLICATTPAWAEEIGKVSTVFKLLSPNDKIRIEAFDDPEVEGVTCYLSRADKGGWSGAVGLAEDTSDGSISCHQTGAIRIKKPLEDGDTVFKKRTSLVFKTMQVVRFFDEKRHTLVYLVYSDRIIEGSPQNSITAVPLEDWNGIKPNLDAMTLR